MSQSTAIVRVTRRFDAAPEKVFDAWLDPRTAGQWLFATLTGTMLKVDIDARVGGAYTIIEQRGQTKAEHVGKYVDIDRPTRLVFTFGPMGFPETLVTVEIKALQKECELTLTHTGVWEEYEEPTRKGWSDILDNLAKFLSGTKLAALAEREIMITRLINAPCERVWEAMMDPQQVVHWWGPKGFTTTIEKMDVRSGGIWKHTMRGPDGANYPNKSVFIDVSKPARVIYSHGGGKEGGRGASFEASWTFEMQGDKTKLIIHMVFPSAEDRDFVVKEYGAIEGGKQTLERLDEYLSGRP